VGRIARFDLGRPARTGVPEIVLAEGKEPEQVVRILRALHRSGRGAIVSRLGPAHRRALAAARRTGVPVSLRAGGRMARLEGPLGLRIRRGPVAILAAGTSDVPIAEEARELLRLAGARVVTAYDVGVAGLHRLLRALARIERSRPELYLVFAGREGALPTVVSGLVRSPVVGVPTSQGYGRGGRGEAALNAMLQACAPIVVVNIDAGVPAALFALHLLARPSASGGPGAPRRR
jgi:NCAIR mutase (PurE)-related protein